MIELITEVTALIASSLAVVIAGHELHSKKKLGLEIVKKNACLMPHLPHKKTLSI